jgi:plasmid stabilization system protein ParE
MNTIRWTDGAEDAYVAFLSTVYDYSADAAIILDEQLENLLDRLSRFKHLCPPLDKIAGLRRCVLTTNIALVYDVSGNEITLISVFDTRSDHPFN